MPETLKQAEGLLQQGHPEAARSLLEVHCASHATDAHAWFLLGAACHQSARRDEALRAFEHSLSLAPHNLNVINAKCAVLGELGRWQEALQTLQVTLSGVIALEMQAPLRASLGIVQEALGDQQAALQSYEQALALQPDYPAALLNYGVLLIRLGRFAAALENNQRLAAHYPAWHAAQQNLGEANLAAGRWSEALAAYERALEIEPSAARTHFTHALALSMLRRFDEARQAFTTAHTLDTQEVERYIATASALAGEPMREVTPEAFYLLRCTHDLEYCDWSGRDALLADLQYLVELKQGTPDAIAEEALVFRSLALPFPPHLRLTLAKNVAQRISAAVQVQRLVPFVHLPHSQKRLRIGYVSPDFGVHPVGHLTQRLYGLHQRSHFEVFGYALSADDGSDIRRDIERGCDHFQSLQGLDDAQAAARIHADGVDILVNLAGYTSHARNGIFALRPAPLQVIYCGFPCTMGAAFMDYFITDAVCSPPGQESQFSEKLVYLPGSCMIYNNHQALSERALSRTALGLPQQGFVFCCFNNSYKIEPVMFEVWMRILKRTPRSVLWLYAKNEAMSTNLRREAKLRGVDEHRLIFASFEPVMAEHLARYRQADLFLDTLHFNAVTTAADALWAGLPVLSHSGTTSISRWATSMLEAVGLDEMVATDLEQYEERACYLATHSDAMIEIKARLAQNRLTLPLFDTERHVRDLESAYQMMWQRYISGAPPDSFHVTNRA